MLRDSLLALIQLEIHLSSTLIILAKVNKSLWEQNKLESSAKRINHRSFEDLSKSLI